MNNKHGPTQGSRNKIRRTIRKFTTKVLFLLSFPRYVAKSCQRLQKDFAEATWEGNQICDLYTQWKHFMCHFAKCKPKLESSKVWSIESYLTVFVITGGKKNTILDNGTLLYYFQEVTFPCYCGDRIDGPINSRQTGANWDAVGFLTLAVFRVGMITDWAAVGTML